MHTKVQKARRWLHNHIHVTRGQRSAGRHIWGPVFARTEWHHYPQHSKTVYWNLTVGNPKVHTKWAFSLWIYFRR